MKLSQIYLTYPLKVLYIFGLWNQKHNRYIYLAYSFFILFFTQYLYAFFQIVYMIMSWGDIGKVAEASFLLLTQATLCIKIVIFVWNKSAIEQVIFYMDCEIFHPQTDLQWSIVDKSVIIQKIEFFIFILMSTFTIALWAVFPLIDAAPQERVLPFLAWYPLPTDQTPCYELLYLYQICGIWFSAMINISIDRLSTAMTANGCAQVEILIDKLINIEEYAKIELKTDIQRRIDKIISISRQEKLPYIDEMNEYNNFRSSVDSNMEEIEGRIDERLNNCVEHHQNIVKFVKGVEKNFHLGILAQFFASVGIICITGLQITLISPTSLKFASKILYFLAMLAQILFLCRIGNDITAISNDLTKAAYLSPWVERQRKYKKTLLIFMERLKQPIVTRAGNFFPLSLHTFVTLLRSAYSYFAVLQQLNSK